MRRALLLFALVACEKDHGGTAEKPAEGPVHQLAGVYPENFKCESIATLDALGPVLDGFKKRADALFAQYRQTSADLVQSYNELADAGAIKPTDAGIVIHAPMGAVDVQVGAKGLDHHGQGLLFIDDDAPCYVRIVGPDPQRRLQLAQLVAKNLTFANAPMSPRPMK